MAALLPHGMVQYHEISRTSRFRTFRGKNMMFFRDYDVIIRGYPQNTGIPCDFGRFHIVKCLTITKLNVTIPVLFKTSI